MNVHISVLILAIMASFVICWETWQSVTLFVGTYFVSKLADMTKPYIETKCPVWFGLEAMEGVKAMGLTDEWTALGCLGAMAMQTLMAAMHQGCVVGLGVISWS